MTRQFPLGRPLPDQPGPPRPRGPQGPFVEFQPPRPLTEYLALARRNAWLIALAGIAGLLLAGWLVSRDRPEYRAVATIRITDERRSMTGGLGDESLDEMMGAGSDRVLTQIQVLESRDIAGLVVDREQLRLVAEEGPLARGELRDVANAADAPPDTIRLRFREAQVIADAARAGSARAAYGEPLVLDGLRLTVPARPDGDEQRLVLTTRRSAIERVRENASASPRERTNVVDVRYVDHDPVVAQRVADALVEEFQRASASGAQQQSRRRRVFVQEQLQETEGLLEDAQLALSAFRRREGVFSSREMFAAQQSAMLQLDVRRQELAADRRMLASLLDRLESSDHAGDELDAVLASPVLASSPVVTQLFGQLVEQQARLDSLLTTGAAATHPDVQRYEGLVTSTRGKLISAARSHLSTLDARLAALEGLRARQEGDIRELPELEAEEARLAQEVQTLAGAADLLRAELQRARIAEAVEAGQVQIVDQAAFPLQPIGSGRTRKLVFGLMLGLMLGGGLAMLRENLDTSIRQKEDIQRVLGLAPLGTVPKLQLGARGGTRPFAVLPAGRKNGRKGGRAGSARSAEPSISKELVALHDNRSSGAEAYRTLRTNLLFSQLGEELKTVVVTSCCEGEGKTTVASNLATTFAQQGVRVLVVDADLRKARLHKVFDLDREPGLTEWVMDEVKVDAAIRATEVERLFVLPSGALPPNPSEILGSKKMRGLMETLREGFELVIFDTPPLRAAGDAAVLGARADGVVMVVRAGETEQGAAQEAVRQLERVRARILGVVLNDPDSTAEQYGEYYHYAYYGD